MKTTALLLAALLLSACTAEPVLNTDYTTKPIFCYQLAPQDMQPGKNCIGSGGHGN